MVDIPIQYLHRLRFPKLFILTAIIFLIDLLVPDFVPFVDEILFGLMTVLLSMLKERKKPEEPEIVIPQPKR